MRVFAAIPLSGPARLAVAAARDQLAGRDWPVRWVPDANLHVTIRFYGEVPEDRIAALGSSLGDAVGRMNSSTLDLGGVGGFPTERRPRVIWVGVSAPAALHAQHERVGRAAEVLGHPAERGPWRPHVTIARLRRGHSLTGIAQQLAEVSVAVSSPADRLVLYHSQPDRGGVTYQSLQVFPFEAAWAV